MITLEQAKDLTHGTILYDMVYRNVDGTPQRWRVNGAPKTWKRNPNRVTVPIKHGLKDCSYLTELSLEAFCLDEAAAKEGKS